MDAKSVAITLPVRGELVGPGSEFEKRRLELRAEYTPIVEAAKKLTVIESQEQAEEATKLGRLLQTGVKEAEIFFKGIKVQIDSIKKPVLEAEKEDTDRLTAEKNKLGRLQTAWDAKCRREREEAERLAREEAAAQAREEQLARAIELEQAGELEQATATLDEPVYVAPVIMQAAAPPQIAGKVSKVNYSMEVVNLMQLVKAIAAGLAPIQAVLPNESFLNAQAKAFKDGFAVAGCRLKREETTHFRA